MPWLRTLICAVGLVWAPMASAVPDRGLETEAPPDATQVVNYPKPKRNGIPAHRLHYSFALFGRINPLGLISTLSLGYRGRLMDNPDSLLFSDTYVFAGLSARASPAFGRIGGRVEVSPIAVWKAWASYEFVGYFGTFDQILGWESPYAKYSDQTLAALGDQASMRLGGVLTLGTTLQAKAGPVAIRSTFSAVRFDLDLPAGENYFYDQFWDRLAPNKQFMFLNDFDVLGFVKNARIGARWTWSDGNMGTTAGDGALAHHRLGPLFAWQFHDRGPGARFEQPTLFVLAQWWLQHPYRTGREQPQGLPLIAIGLAFKGDLIGDKPPRRRDRKGRKGS